MAIKKLSTEGPVPLVLFSGGLDSTYLLASLLETTDVDVLYVNGPQHPDKLVAEHVARKKILAWLKKNRAYSVRTELEHDVQKGVPCGVAYRYSQVLPWFYAAMTHATGRLHTEVNIAYVQGDGVSRHLTEVTWAWDYLKNVVVEHPVPLRFPLEDTSKAYMIAGMDPKLYKLIWFCETPLNKKPCGKCVPCVTHKTEVYRLGLLNQNNQSKS